MGDRAIRLREFGPNRDLVVTPTATYRAARNGHPEAKEYRVRTDENGFMLSGDFTATAKIVGFGDSVMECAFIDEGDRACAKIERRLDGRAQVLNGGYSGASSLHILNTIINKTVPLRPRGLFIMTGVIDVEAMQKKNSFWTNDSYLRPIFEPENDSGERDISVVDHIDFQSRNQITKSIIDTCRNFSIPVCFISTPHLQVYSGYFVTNYYSSETFAQLRDARLAANSSTRDLCRDLSVPYFDIQPAFSERPDRLHDDKHMNSQGTEALMASLSDLGFFGLMEAWCATEPAMSRNEVNSRLCRNENRPRHLMARLLSTFNR